MLGLSVIILFKSVLHVFCSLVFSAHNSSALRETILLALDCEFALTWIMKTSGELIGHFGRKPKMSFGNCESVWIFLDSGQTQGLKVHGGRSLLMCWHHLPLGQSLVWVEPSTCKWGWPSQRKGGRHFCPAYPSEGNQGEKGWRIQSLIVRLPN